jgi:Ni/Fe-hydrogenase subunit HybB-like protein
MSVEDVLHFDTTWEGWRIRMTPVRAVLAALSGVFVLCALFRLFTGLGASTNLNDIWPWGLWIGFDLTAVALAGAGYSTCVLSHVLHIDAVHSISRRAMLLSLLGYVFVLATLILEIGRWDNSYMPLISWGHTSALFEVYVAITIYMVIQTIEFSEVATEKIFHSANRYVQLLLPTAFIIGGILPFGHQASLGAIYLLMKGRLHPLWWSEMLPWFFLVTSFYVGQSIVILESICTERGFGHQADQKAMLVLQKISAWIMAGYFVFKFADLARLHQLGLLATPSVETGMLLLEMLGCVLVPVLIACTAWGRTKPGLLVFAALSIAGVILSRVNVVFTGMYRSLGPGYVPSFVEWGITIGLFAAIGLAYIFIVENFNIFLPSHSEHKAS